MSSLPANRNYATINSVGVAVGGIPDDTGLKLVWRAHAEGGGVMQRSKIRGADIKPDPVQNNNINAEKCIKYLRGIGVEVDDATADEWLDTQGVHRFLCSEQRALHLIYYVHCRCGELSGYTVHTRGRTRRRKKKDGEDLSEYFCEQCQTWITNTQVLIYEVRRDGGTRDYRPASEQAGEVFDWRGLVNPEEER